MKRLDVFSLGRWSVLVCVAGLFGLNFSIAAADEKPEHTEAEKAAMEEVRKLGGHVMELAQNDPHLEVGYHLADGDVGDDHLKPVAKMPLLVSLNLRGTKITNAGLVHLKQAKSLKRLHLENTKVSDEGLTHLSGLENLEYLNLYGTAVTDAGLKHLEGLKKLKKLYLWQTEVTDAGVEGLKSKLPEVDIIRGLSLAEPEKDDESKEKEDEKKEDSKKDEEKKDEDKKKDE